jgi:carbon starvation protein
MNALLLLLVCGGGFLLAYHTYGKYLGQRIFRIDPDAAVPSRVHEDGTDFVPTKKGVIFGHHYTSIAGTGPIVGPAIGLIWGWLPALIWVFFGSIFIGAVHDFGSLIVSMRNEGESLSEVAAKYINKRVRLIFFILIFLILLIIIAVFGVVIAAVFARFPSSVIPVWLQIPIALILGRAIYSRGYPIIFSTAVAVLCMYLSMILGSMFPVGFNSFLGLPATGFWVIVLLIYAFFASTLSVKTLLQPRDYINAWQLFIAMGLLAAGTITISFLGKGAMVAPAINPVLPAGTPPMFPFLFIIIACGAVSGFHSLVASGTSPKQVASESDARFIGYGAMLMEGVLALLVIICAGAGIGLGYTLDNGTTLLGSDAWNHFYGNWIGARGLVDKLAPVVEGASNLVESMGLPEMFGITVMGVFIASFASTTLDTAVRLQRYIVVELAEDFSVIKLKNRWTATFLCVLCAAGLAFISGADGTGAMKLWPLFGSANQLLAAMALLMVTLYLQSKGGLKWLVSGAPCLFMVVISNWSIIENGKIFMASENWLLVFMDGLFLLLSLWITIEALVTFFQYKGAAEKK